MIKDPFCEVYFPKRNGVHLNLSGKDLYFCSNQCKDKYLAAQSEKKE
jgi:YHS domain-containing protein